MDPKFEKTGPMQRNNATWIGITEKHQNNKNSIHQRKVPAVSKLFCSVLIPHFQLHWEFVCVIYAKKNMAHVHFFENFPLTVKSLKGNATWSKVLHAKDDESDDDIDEDRNTDDVKN